MKWLCLFVQAAVALFAIAMTGLFATGVAASVLLIASHDRPFLGAISVAPEPLLQVMPEGGS